MDTIYHCDLILRNHILIAIDVPEINRSFLERVPKRRTISSSVLQHPSQYDPRLVLLYSLRVLTSKIQRNRIQALLVIRLTMGLGGVLMVRPESRGR
jgi:hypothetical protein